MAAGFLRLWVCGEWKRQTEVTVFISYIRRHPLLPYSCLKALGPFCTWGKGNYAPPLEKSCLRVHGDIFKIAICLSSVSYNFSIHTNPFLACFIVLVQFVFLVSFLFFFFSLTPNVNLWPKLVFWDFVFIHIYSERLSTLVSLWILNRRSQAMCWTSPQTIIPVTRLFFIYLSFMGKNSLDS